MTDFLSDEDRKLLEATLATVGAVKVITEYSGEGDSGQVEDVYFTDAQGNAIDVSNIQLPWWTEHTSFVDGKWQHTRTQKNLPLRDVVIELCYSAIDRTGHAGWENNDGGRGELIIDVTETPPTFVLNHSDYITTSEDYEHTL